jgi:hypothetical protein
MPRAGSLVIVLSLALTAHAQEAIAPFVPPNASSVSGTVLRGQLVWGGTDGWPGAPDFFCRHSNSQSSLVRSWSRVLGPEMGRGASRTTNGPGTMGRTEDYGRTKVQARSTKA